MISRRWAPSLALHLLVTSCAPQVHDDPIAVMVDREASYTQRRRAGEQAERLLPDDARRIEALHTLLWEPLYPGWQRQYAIDQLLIHDPDFKTRLGRRIVLLKNWQVRRYVFDLAVREGWVDFTPALVRAYAQQAPGMKDLERPERAAIEKLHPGRPIEQVIVDIFPRRTAGTTTGNRSPPGRCSTGFVRRRR